MASVFSTAQPPAAKSAIDGALAAAGWEPPDWYRFFKSVEGRLGSAASMRLAAQEARPREHRRGRGTGSERVSPIRATSSATGFPSPSGPSSWPDSTKGPGGGSWTTALPPWPNSASLTTRGSYCWQPAPDLRPRGVAPLGRHAATGPRGRLWSLTRAELRTDRVTAAGWACAACSAMGLRTPEAGGTRAPHPVPDPTDCSASLRPGPSPSAEALPHSRQPPPRRRPACRPPSSHGQRREDQGVRPNLASRSSCAGAPSGSGTRGPIAPLDR